MAMTMTIENVTPDTAQSYLDLSVGNRTIRQHRIAKYCRDRLNGKWFLTHQGIAFDTDGKLRDGHHRLLMVVKTDLQTPFAVFRNVSKSGLAYIDSGLSRSTRDAFGMADKGSFSNEYLSVARNFTSFPNLRNASRDPSNEELLADINRFRPALDFAIQHLPSKIPGVSRSTRTLVARAYYYVEHDRLQEFCEILQSGLPKHPQQDTAAIVLRNYLMASRRHAGTGLEQERFWKAQSALSYFAKREGITRLYGTDADLYPVPKQLLSEQGHAAEA